MRGLPIVLILLLVIGIGFNPVCTHKMLPVKLQRCYSNNGRIESPLPMNLQVILDIIRKLERHTQHTMTMRTFSASLIKGFKLDGVRHMDVVTDQKGVLNWVPSGSQRARNRIVQELIPGTNRLISEAEEVLTRDEFCTLHFALSNTIWEHYEPQEEHLCEPHPLEGYSLDSSAKGKPSKFMGGSCPKESGVVLTPFYTVALGSVIAAIAAALEPQNVKTRLLLSNPIADELGGWTFPGIDPDVELIVPRNSLNHDRSMWLESATLSNSRIDNVWMSTISGELAEMVIYQGSIHEDQMYLGAAGFWNSTVRPQLYYLRQGVKNFDVTRAKIIGGVDGLIIGKNIAYWMKNFDGLRLSQVLDMYYSEEGVAFDRNVRVCQRSDQFQIVAPENVLEEETYAAAQALGYLSSVAPLSQNVLRRMVRHSVDIFLRYTSRYFFGAVQCHGQTPSKRPRVELLLAFDGSWTRFYTTNFFSELVEDFDVSTSGSRMGIINGENGEWLLNVTNSPSTVHQSINNLKDIRWPKGMNLVVVFKTILTYLDEYWDQKRRTNTIGGYGHAVVLLVFKLVMTKTELVSAITVLNEIKSRYPEVYFVYYTRNSTAESLKSFVLTKEDTVVTSLKIDEISRYLLEAPMTIKLPGCDKNITNLGLRMEDYVGLSESMTYRLHSHAKTSIRTVLELRGAGYGDLRVCSWNQLGTSDKRFGVVCQDLLSNDDVYSKDHVTCGDFTCPDTFIQVSGKTTFIKCMETDCRSPDQMKFTIQLKLFDYSSCLKILVNPTLMFIFMSVAIFL